MQKQYVKILALSICCAAVIPSAQAATWYNETDVANECDYCAIQFPASVTLTPGEQFSLFGQIYEAGITESGGASSSVLVEAGYGSSGTDPRLDASWQWFPATYNTQVGNNDEYQAALIIAVPGSYAYTFRFSLDNGQGFTAADLDGAGSNLGLTFNPANLGKINDASVVPVPGSAIFMFSAIAVLGALMRKSRRLYVSAV